MAQTEESACNAGDSSSVPGLRKSPGEGNGNPLQYFLAWKIPWTEEAGELQSMELQRVGHDWLTNTHRVDLSLFGKWWEHIIFFNALLFIGEVGKKIILMQS